ncbi:MAG: FCD domain-containing protein [Amaricoccus sp.]
MIYIATTKLAAEVASRADLDGLKGIQRRFRQAAADADVEERILCNNEFHLEIGRIARNDYLMPRLTRLLIDHGRIGRTFFRSDPSVQEQLDVAADQHDEIIDAIARHDAEEGAGARRHGHAGGCHLITTREGAHDRPANDRPNTA